VSLSRQQDEPHESEMDPTGETTGVAG
jgi:hypothetical protein